MKSNRVCDMILRYFNLEVLMINQTRNNLKGCIILCLASLIWGLAFVAQSDAADLVPSFLFNSLRSLIAVAFLAGLLLLKKAKTKIPIFPADKNARKGAILGGALCGVFLTVSVNLQQFGIANYPQGAPAEARGGFLTSLYVVLVPLLSVFLGKKLKLVTLASVLISVCGFYMLCLWDGVAGIYLGDLLMLLCALTFSFHILTVDRFGSEIDGILLSMIQFAVCGVLSGLLSLGFETVEWQNVLKAAFPILYTGVMSSGVAYTMQIYGQKYAEPAIASLAMSLESVFAALGGWVIAGNALSLPEFIGCALVFFAIVLAQIPQLLETRKGRKSQ